MSGGEKLFSYGTLQYESVQQSTFGRLLKGAADTLIGWRLSTVTIRDPGVLEASGEAVHPTLIPGGADDRVSGMVFEVTSEELRQADIYESENYRRARVTLESGTPAWVYVSAGT